MDTAQILRLSTPDLAVQNTAKSLEFVIQYAAVAGLELLYGSRILTFSPDV